MFGKHKESLHCTQASSHIQHQLQSCSLAVVSAPLTVQGAAHRYMLPQSAYRPSIITSETHRQCGHSAELLLLPPLPVLPASHVLEGPYWRIRCHQAIGHPLVHQGGVGGYSTQQHREASVQYQTNAAQQKKR